MDLSRLYIIVIGSIVLGGCSSSAQIRKPAQISSSPQESQESRIVLPKSPPAKKILKKEPRRIPETDPQLAIVAQQKIKKAKKLYSTGQYDEAERLLKESITIFPFLAQAQLTLGKIFLIKGSAARDIALLNSARLMFEMARAIDPGQAEIQTLLELFTVQYPE